MSLKIINCHHPFDCRFIPFYQEGGQERVYLLIYSRATEGIARALNKVHTWLRA
jgi:hypothetical protein